MDKDRKDSFSRKVAVGGFILASITAIFTSINFFQNIEEKKIIEEINIRRLIAETWDLIGGNTGTLWVEEKFLNIEEQRRLEEARRKIVNEILVTQPNNKKGLNLKGIYCAKINKINEAITQFRKVIELYPDFYDAYTNLGVVLKKKGEVDVAITYYKKSIKIEGRNFRAYYCLGNALMGKKMFDEALVYFKKSIEINPHFALAYNNLGYIFHKKRKYEEALRAYKKAIEIDKWVMESQCNIALIYLTLKEFEKAYNYYRYVNEDLGANTNVKEDVIKNISELLKKKPDITFAYLIRGYFYKELGKNHEVKKDVGRFIKYFKGKKKWKKISRKLLLVE